MSARRVDLIGDYAGKELFLLEGDSLLLQCFSNPKLDFDGNLLASSNKNAVALADRLTLNRRFPAITCRLCC